MKLLRQIFKFLKAWTWWVVKGSPKRTPAEVAEIFWTHCYPCVHYHPELRECTICECTVSPDPEERNKIVYKTEHCPPEEGKW